LTTFSFAGKAPRFLFSFRGRLGGPPFLFCSSFFITVRAPHASTPTPVTWWLPISFCKTLVPQFPPQFNRPLFPTSQFPLTLLLFHRPFSLPFLEFFRSFSPPICRPLKSFFREVFVVMSHHWHTRSFLLPRSFLSSDVASFGR